MIGYVTALIHYSRWVKVMPDYISDMMTKMQNLWDEIIKLHSDPSKATCVEQVTRELQKLF